MMVDGLLSCRDLCAQMSSTSNRMFSENCPSTSSTATIDVDPEYRCRSMFMSHTQIRSPIACCFKSTRHFSYIHNLFIGFYSLFWKICDSLRRCAKHPFCRIRTCVFLFQMRLRINDERCTYDCILYN